MSSPDNNGSDSVENQLFVLLAFVLINIGLGAVLYCLVRLIRMFYATQSPLPNMSTGDIELVPILRENFLFVHGESECIICLEEFAPNVVLADTICGHAFHLYCLRRWNTNSCPMCRRNLV